MPSIKKPSENCVNTLFSKFLRKPSANMKKCDFFQPNMEKRKERKKTNDGDPQKIFYKQLYN